MLEKSYAGKAVKAVAEMRNSRCSAGSQNNMRPSDLEECPSGDTRTARQKNDSERNGGACKSDYPSAFY